MFEARLISSGTLKKVLDSIKDLLNEATFDCSDSGIQVRRNEIIYWKPDGKCEINSTAASHGQLARFSGLAKPSL